MGTLSAHDHAVIMYREMLVSLQKFNEAEAEYKEILSQELRSMPRSRSGDNFNTVTAESRADTRATNSGVYGRLNYHRERVSMHAMAYLVSVNYFQTFESHRGS